MIINQRYGIKFNRNNQVSNLKLIEFIISSDLAYEIIQEICLKRNVSTTQFCLEKHVSLSQLRRKIKEINDSLKKFELHISIATNMKIIGNEFKIRTLFFNILFLVHRKITNLRWVVNQEEYLVQTRKIFNYLDLKINDAYIDAIAISYFINSISIKNNHYLDQTIENNFYFKEIKVKEKPEFLKHWSNSEWKFMILSIFISDPSTIDSVIKLAPLEEISMPINALKWIKIFEAEVSKINPAQKNIIYFRFYKHLVAKQVLQLSDYLLSFSHPFDYDFIEKNYPLFVKKFNQIWQIFSQQADDYFLSNYFKAECMILSFTLLPQQTYFPKIKLYLYSEYTAPFNTYVQEQIRTYFSNRFNLEFVENQRSAQIIISTEDDLNLQLPSKIPVISINLYVLKKDLKAIEKQLIITVENDYNPTYL
nr:MULTISPECIES: helix-turn-helix domain-containing protein [unclassified Enterococcus]